VRFVVLAQSIGALLPLNIATDATRPDHEVAFHEFQFGDSALVFNRTYENMVDIPAARLRMKIPG
jgi:hypothetical protein